MSENKSRLVRPGDELQDEDDEKIQYVAQQVFQNAGRAAIELGGNAVVSGFLSGTVNFMVLAYGAENTKKVLTEVIEHVDTIAEDMDTLALVASTKGMTPQ